MPRLLPRLAQIVAQPTENPKFTSFSKPKRRKSLYDATRSTLHAPTFHFQNHERSILLSDAEPNPITNSWVYEHHKTLPPVVTLPKGFKSRAGEGDKPREMTEDERRWWSSPYLRMLSTPLRRCSVTDQYLPSDLLLRFSFLRLPSSESTRPSLSIIPDGIEHPKFTSRKGGHSFYTLCLREAIDQMLRRTPFKPMTRDARVIPNPNISSQVAHLLRLRVLQELERLADCLRYPPLKRSNGDTRILRRLSKEELTSIETTNTIPIKDAIAVLSVPSVEARSVDQAVRQQGMSALPSTPFLNPEEVVSPGIPPSLKCTLIPMQADFQPSSNESSVGSRLLPISAVPFYDGLTAFPHMAQYCALQQRLSRILDLEQRRMPTGSNPKGSDPVVGKDVSGNLELSDAYILCSNQSTVKRGDVAAVAVALWRLRMFEGLAGSEGSWSLGVNNDITRLV